MTLILVLVLRTIRHLHHRKHSSPASPLGNLFDDLEDLPQPKTVDAELPKPKLDAELPGVQEPQEPETVEPVDVAEEQAGLQAPEFTVPTPEPTPPTPSLPGVLPWRPRAPDRSTLS